MTRHFPLIKTELCFLPIFQFRRLKLATMCNIIIFHQETFWESARTFPIYKILHWVLDYYRHLYNLKKVNLAGGKITQGTLIIQVVWGCVNDITILDQNFQTSALDVKKNKICIKSAKPSAGAHSEVTAVVTGIHLMPKKWPRQSS